MLQECATNHDTGAVEEDVETTMPGSRVLHGGFDVFKVSDVSCNRRRHSARCDYRGGNAFCGCQVDVGDDHCRALARERGGRGATNSAGATEHDYRPVAESHCGLSDSAPRWNP